MVEGKSCSVPSGTEAYAKLYPDKSSDGVLRLGNVVPGANLLNLSLPGCAYTLCLPELLPLQI